MLAIANIILFFIVFLVFICIDNYISDERKDRLPVEGKTALRGFRGFL